MQSLDDDAWAYMKKEALPRVIERHPNRGWQALFDILNQTHAYNYLRRIGCQTVAFIPRQEKKKRTTDLDGWLPGSRVLCEVKTINISDDEIDWRKNPIGAREVRDAADRLAEGFFRKLSADIEEARKQLMAYDPTREARHVVYVCPIFDDWVCTYKAEYVQQIDEHLIEQRVTDIKIVMQNAFHPPLTMKAATVDNGA